MKPLHRWPKLWGVGTPKAALMALNRTKTARSTDFSPYSGQTVAKQWPNRGQTVAKVKCIRLWPPLN